MLLTSGPLIWPVTKLELIVEVQSRRALLQRWLIERAHNVITTVLWVGIEAKRIGTVKIGRRQRRRHCPRTRAFHRRMRFLRRIYLN